ncbi:MAG: peptidase C39 family protein [Candidatus Paceibacterota bacterium]|jgi:predicted double-glycine peptidase
MMLVPYYKQKTDYTCGPACLKMVFEYLGKKEVTKEELGVLVKTHPERGTSTDDMRLAVIEHGLFYSEKKEASLEDIRSFIARDIPVIVDFIEPEDEDRHFAVVVGIDTERITLNDPWHGEGFTMPVDDFEKRWGSPKNRYPKWLMAISRKEEDLH